MNIVITTNLKDKNYKDWGYTTDGKQIGRYHYPLKTFQPSFDIKNFIELTKYDYDGLKHDYKTFMFSFTVNSIKNNKIIFNFKTNTRFYILFTDNDHEYTFKNIIGNDYEYINNSPIKDHTIVINRNKSNNNNNNVKLYIYLLQYHDNHEFKITNFGDVINKLK
jgi:hypothetical protein